MEKMSEYLLRIKAIHVDVTDVENGRITGIKFDNAIFKRISETKQEKENEKPNHAEETKTCSKCNTTKPSSMFYSQKGVCKDCVSKYNKEYNSKKKKSKPSPIEISGAKPIHTPEKNFDWNNKRDSLLVANFESLGVSGIFDKSLLPGFTMTEIRKRCIELKLMDEYGRPKKKGGESD